MSDNIVGEFYVELDAPVRGVDGDGWEHHAFAYEIVPVNEAFPAITGTYRVGTGIHKNTVTGEDVLESVARDLEMATEAWCSRPNIREIIATFEHDYGYESPTRVYDMAVELVGFVDWYWSLSDGEQQELQDIAESED